MSFDAFLNQTCMIARSVPVSTDRYNNAVPAVGIVDSNVRCRKTQKQMRMMDERTGEYAFGRVDLILFAAGVDVQPKDEITIGSDVWRVTQDFHRAGMIEQRHVSVMVEAINVR